MYITGKKIHTSKLCWVRLISEKLLINSHAASGAMKEECRRAHFGWKCRYAVIAVGKRLIPFFVTRCGRIALHVLFIVMLIKRASSNKLKIRVGRGSQKIYRYAVAVNARFWFSTAVVWQATAVAVVVCGSADRKIKSTPKLHALR